MFRVMVPAGDRLPQRDCMVRTIRRGAFNAFEVAQTRVHHLAEYGPRTVEIPAMQQCLHAIRVGFASQADQQLTAGQRYPAGIARQQFEPVLPAEVKVRFASEVLSGRCAGFGWRR